MDEIEDIQQWLKENWTGFGSKIDYVLYSVYNQHRFSDIYFDLREEKLKVSGKVQGNQIPAVEYDIDSSEVRESINIMRNGKDQFIYIPTVIQYNGAFRTLYMNDSIVLRVVPNQSGTFKIEFTKYMIEKIRFKNRLETQLPLSSIKEEEINTIKI